MFHLSVQHSILLGIMVFFIAMSSIVLFIKSQESEELSSHLYSIAMFLVMITLLLNG